MNPIHLNYIIIDDEQDAIDQLQNLLNELGGFKMLGSLTSGQQAISMIKQHQPDVVFLDIQMPEKNGITLLSEIAQLENKPHVVMVTAYSNYVLDALRNSAFDYLLKPIDRDELKICTQRLTEQQKVIGKKQDFQIFIKNLSDKIQLSGVYETYFIDANEIAYIEADGRYSDVHLTNGTRIKTTCNLGKLEEQINHQIIKRISRSRLINANYLYKLDHKSKTCVLQYNENEVELGYSKKYLG